jgi:CheY-like chemotaxis protein
MAESRKTVLVVDDDLDIRECLQILLPRYGFGVATAEDGAEALAWLRSGVARPCLVLLDIMMPGMNGLELYAHMSRDPSLARIPIVVSTGAGRIMLEEAGALDVEILLKPFELPALLATIRRVCGDAGAG